VQPILGGAVEALEKNSKHSWILLEAISFLIISETLEPWGITHCQVIALVDSSAELLAMEHKAGSERKSREAQFRYNIGFKMQHLQGVIYVMLNLLCHTL